MLVRGQRLGRSPFEIFRIVNRAFDCRKRPALARQFERRAHRNKAHKLNHLRREFLPFLGAVTDAAVVHQIGQSHDAQANAARAVSSFCQLRHCRDIGVGLHHIIQKAGGQINRIRQFFPINCPIGPKMLRQIDRTQAAVFIRAKPLLAARIGGFQRIQMRHRVLAVGGIQEQHTRLAVVVRLPNDAIKQFACPHHFFGDDRHPGSFHGIDGASYLAVFRIMHIRKTQRPILIIFHRAHEGIGDTDRNIEIGDLVFVGLASDKFFHVRVVNPQHCHVGAAPGTALGDLAKGIVIHPQEAYRPGRLPGRRPHHAALGTQSREGKPVTSAGLLNQSSIAQGLENPSRVAAHVIADGQHKAGCQLPQRGACAGEGGRIGKESFGG